MECRLSATCRLPAQAKGRLELSPEPASLTDRAARKRSRHWLTGFYMLAALTV
jgi:hypothetical protein